MSTVGVMLLAAIRKSGSRAALHELSDDILSTEQERSLRDFLRNYIQEHQTFPKPLTVRRETRITLPVTDEPYTYYLNEARRRALYQSIREPYAALTEALQNGGRIDMTAAISAITAMSSNVNRFVGAGSGIEQSDTILERVLSDFQEASINHDLRGITSGWAELDAETLGYQPADLITWVGRPGRGKSWLLIKQAYAAWTAGHKVLYISMEMSAEATMRRMIGLHSGINPTLIRAGTVQTLAQPTLLRAFAEMQERNPIDVCTANFDRSVDQIHAFVEQYQPDIVMVDAGYLLTPRKKRYGSSGRRETISDVIEELKQLAGNINRPVVLTVQFNRVAEQRRRGAQRQAGEEDGENQINYVNPLAHLGLDMIGETDVIGQASSHVFGIELAPPPFQRSMRVFGFLKGREGEDGHWYCNYPETKASRIDLSIVPTTDERLQSIIARANNDNRRVRNRNRQRTDLGFMRGNNAA